jgi:hypothetical protein
MKFALAVKGFELGIELLELVLNHLTSMILKPQVSVIPQETNLKPWVTIMPKCLKLTTVKNTQLIQKIALFSPRALFTISEKSK